MRSNNVVYPGTPKKAQKSTVIMFKPMLKLNDMPIKLVTSIKKVASIIFRTYFHKKFKGNAIIRAIPIPAIINMTYVIISIILSLLCLYINTIISPFGVISQLQGKILLKNSFKFFTKLRFWYILIEEKSVRRNVIETYTKA